MSKSEIQSLVTLISSSVQVLVLLLLSHTTPSLLANRVATHVVSLGRHDGEEVPRDDTDEISVSAAVMWLIILTVDVRSNDGGGLNAHVVQSGADSSCAHRTGVSRRQSDQDWVDVWVSDKHDAEDILGPWAGTFWQDCKGDDEWQHVDLAAENHEESVVDLLREPDEQDHLEQEQEVCRDGEQVDLEGRPAELTKGEGEVRGNRYVGQVPSQTKEVKWPHVVVGECLPKKLEGKTLTVVHVSLSWIIAKNAVDHDDFLALCEPTILATELRSSLSWRWWKVEPSEDTDEDSKTTLKGEKPTPALPVGDTAHAEDTKGEESSDDVGHDVGTPEEGQTDRKLGTLVEVGEVQDDIWNESTLNETEECTSCVEGLLSRQAALADGDDRPADHLNRNPVIRSKLLGDELRWKLGREEAEVEDRHAIVVLVGVEAEIVEHVVGERLRDVTTIELEGEEHQTGEGHNLVIKSADQLLLLLLSPLGVWIPSVTTFVAVNRSIVLSITTGGINRSGCLLVCTAVARSTS